MSKVLSSVFYVIWFFLVSFPVNYRDDMEMTNTHICPFIYITPFVVKSFVLPLSSPLISHPPYKCSDHVELDMK